MSRKNKGLICGIGINDVDYVTQKWSYSGRVGGTQSRKLVWVCPFYRVWKDMIHRCYNERALDRDTTYTGCVVQEEWLTFSNFKVWMEKQDWECKQLDKDILIKGNKVYSSKTCVFVTQDVNTFIIERGISRGKWPIGVCWKERNSKFAAYCRNPFTRKQEHLGLFADVEKAHQAWLTRKLELAKLLAAEQDDPRVAKALIDRYEKYNAHCICLTS